MYADNTKRFGCIDCGYFTNIKCNIKKHNLTLLHKKNGIEDKQNILLNQCKVCNKLYKCRSGLWRHNKSCIEKTRIDEMHDKIIILTMMVDEISKTKMNINHMNVVNNITNNIQIFLNEKCKDAMNMNEFINRIIFCGDNYSKSNLLIVNALDHTAKIFEKHLNAMTIYERPIHHFNGEDHNQLIAHYRHNNVWKCQSEVSILDEIYHDYNGDEPKDSFVYYLGQFHKRRLDYFDINYTNNKYLGRNLLYTTYPEQQIGLVRKLLEMSKIDV